MTAEDKNRPKEVHSSNKSCYLLEAVFIVLALAILIGTPIAIFAKNSSLPSSQGTNQVIDILARNDMIDTSGHWLVQTGSDWDYSNLAAPSEIKVKQGDTVTLRITSFDVTHGFELDAYGINVPVYAGKFTDVNFVANKLGKFPFECSTYCGMGHTEMTGWLIVGPNS